MTGLAFSKPSPMWPANRGPTTRSAPARVIAAFLRSWNDTLGDDDRNRLLKPLIPRLVGTAAGPEVEDRRVWMSLDWLVREYTPAWLRAAGLIG